MFLGYENSMKLRLHFEQKGTGIVSEMKMLQRKTFKSTLLIKVGLGFLSKFLFQLLWCLEVKSTIKNIDIS